MLIPLITRVGRFGEIVNVSVDMTRKTALVRFANPDGARAAKQSAVPVLDHPGIKLVYREVHEGQPKSGDDVDKSDVRDIHNVQTPKVSGKRNLRDLKNDYARSSKDFIAASTQKIQKLLALTNKKETTEQMKKDIYKTIDEIQHVMASYRKEKRPDPSNKGKGKDKDKGTVPQPETPKRPLSGPQTPKRKKYELYLEDILPQYQTYDLLLPKLKAFSFVHLLPRLS